MFDKKFTTQLVHTTKSGNENNLLVIVFDRKIDISQSRFKIDEQTFVTRLGGSVSSGRTLLWILVGLLGTFQARLEKVSLKEGQADMIFVKNFTQPDFQPKNFTPVKCGTCDLFTHDL